MGCEALVLQPVVAGRANGLKDKTNRKLAALVAGSYRRAMLRFAEMPILDAWYYQVDASSVVDLFAKYAGKSAKQAGKTVKKARSRTRERTLEKMTQMVDGKRQIINAPPLVVRLANLLTDEQKAAARQQGDAEKAWQQYLESLPEERRRLLRRYHVTDAALRVGGVGSVGTRCMITLLEGDKPDDALILQQKEAGHSALSAYLPERNYTSQAQRVVIGQRLIQASSDIFLGRHHGGSGVQYYWRQLKDMKGSFDVTTLDAKGLGAYLGVCSLCLARAHARSGDPIAISAYLGKSDSFDKAISKFATAYADQTEKDHQALLDAIKSGRVLAQEGV